MTATSLAVPVMLSRLVTISSSAAAGKLIAETGFITSTISRAEAVWAEAGKSPWLPAKSTARARRRYSRPSAQPAPQVTPRVQSLGMFAKVQELI